MFVIFSVFYILIAAAMIVLILMQRGEGANAGASFGGGSSGTVFGARGSASFMSRATGVLATLFFILSLGMAIYLAHSGAPKQDNGLGVMSEAGTHSSQTTGHKQTPAAAAATSPARAVPKATVPAAGASAGGASQSHSAAPAGDVPQPTVGGHKQGTSGKSDSGQHPSGSGK